MKKRPFFVELIGPAGSGKTTIVKTMCQENKNIVKAPKPTYRYARNLPFFIRNALPLMPVLLRQRPNSKWPTYRQIWWMIYLNGWYHTLSRQTSNGCILKVMDHGPLYMLTSLLEFGPEITQGQDFRKWWDRMLRQWASFLDMIIWLDAPNSILVKRINTRDTWHVVKEKPEQEMHEFLFRYRISLEQIISLSKAHNNCLRVLHFHTDQETPEQITNKILCAYEMHLKGVTLMSVNK